MGGKLNNSLNGVGWMADFYYVLEIVKFHVFVVVGVSIIAIVGMVSPDAVVPLRACHCICFSGGCGACGWYDECYRHELRGRIMQR